MDELQTSHTKRAHVFLEDQAVEDLRRRLRGRLMGPQDPGYDQARRVWNGAVDKRPALIAHCRDVADVMAAVNFARTAGLPVSARGGGHNVAGKALCDDGVVIDLSAMRGVRVDPSHRVAVVEGGATLGDLDHATQAFGLAAPVGVVSATGVAGLTLHGGYGWLSRRFGLSIDNVLGVDVVTADGQLRHASGEENPDLFWAVRGGGGDFGVVTAFEFRLHPVGPQVWQGLTMYPLAQAKEALCLFREYMREAPEELTSIAVLWSVPEAPPIPEHAWGQPAVIFLSCYTGPLEQGEQALRPFREFGQPIADLSSPMPFTQVQQALDADYPDGRFYYWKSIYLKELGDEAIEVLAARGADRPSPISSLDIWALGGATARIAPEDTPFGMRTAPFLIGVEANWIDPSEAEANIAWARRVVEDLKPYSAGGSYLNFPGFYEEGDALLKGAYGDNIARLKAIKAKYDPSNVFGGGLAGA
jgi:FAD/FMN-containing dehydrogenase